MEYHSILRQQLCQQHRNSHECDGLLNFPAGCDNLLAKQKPEKHHTLLSSEVEFVALSKAAKEIKFMVQVMQSLEILVKLVIIVRVDNIGAIFMLENLTTSQRTKHIDIRYHFVHEFMEDGFI